MHVYNKIVQKDRWTYTKVLEDIAPYRDHCPKRKKNFVLIKEGEGYAPRVLSWGGDDLSELIL